MLLEICDSLSIGFVLFSGTYRKNILFLENSIKLAVSSLIRCSILNRSFHETHQSD